MLIPIIPLPEKFQKECSLIHTVFIATEMLFESEVKLGSYSIRVHSI